MGKRVAEGEIDAAFGHAKGDAMGVVFGLAASGVFRGRGIPCGDDRAVAELGKPRIGRNDAVNDRAAAAPGRHHTSFRGKIGDLDLRPQAIECEAFDEVRHQRGRQVEQEPLAIGKDDEVEQDLSLRGEQPAIGRAARVRAADLRRDQVIQELRASAPPMATTPRRSNTTKRASDIAAPVR